MKRLITRLKDLREHRMMMGATLLLIAVTVLSAGAVLANPSSDPERDNAVSAAFAAARVRGENNPRLESAVADDAANLRAANPEVAPGLKGRVWVITLDGIFAPLKAPPHGDEAAAHTFHKAVMYIQNGRVVAGFDYP